MLFLLYAAFAAAALPCARVTGALAGTALVLIAAAFEPDRFSQLLIWRNFLQGGGRLVLGLTLIDVLAVVIG